jgi:hypothetical protein
MGVCASTLPYGLQHIHHHRDASCVPWQVGGMGVVLAAYDARLDANHPSPFELDRGLGSILFDEGKYAQARAVQEKLVETVAKRMGDDTPDPFDARAGRAAAGAQAARPGHRDVGEGADARSARQPVKPVAFFVPVQRTRAWSTAPNTPAVSSGRRAMWV